MLMTQENEHDPLTPLIERGRVFYNLSGSVPREIIASMVEALPASLSIDKKLLLEAVLDRESLMPTAIGNGIALPHPRNPLINDPAGQFVTVGFLKNTVDWKALDGKPVHTVLLIVSASPKLHLHTLSQISFLCQQEDFRKLLINRASPEEIIGAIKAMEETWG